MDTIANYAAHPATSHKIASKDRLMHGFAIGKNQKDLECVYLKYTCVR